MSPEAWLSGPVAGVPPLLMPVAHALLQAQADLEVARDLSPDELWARPGKAASVGFHLKHIPGSMDRLLTYAEGNSLSQEQLTLLRAEAEPGTPPADAPRLLVGVDQAVNKAIVLLRRTDEAELLSPREVGRARLPSTLLGLLFHVAEHTQRHVGQVVTTVKIVRGLGIE